jgi:hypothetical protein
MKFSLLAVTAFAAVAIAAPSPNAAVEARNNKCSKYYNE